MTSDEMSRAIEFILQHEAQVSIRLEEVANHLEEVANDLKQLGEYQKRDHGLLAEMAVQGQRVSTLLEIQSRRLDRAEKEDRAAQKRHEELQMELRAGLDRIFAKLSEKPHQ